jgi:hypothetical protein
MTNPGTPSWPCPCCGYLVFSEPPGSHEICPACGWEDDLSQLRFAAQDGGPNHSSLVSAQQAFASQEREAASDSGQPGNPGHDRDPAWRHINPDIDRIEVPVPGRDYGRTYAASTSSYYYWRTPA